MNKQDIQTVLDALKQPIGFIGCREIDVKLREAITICEAALAEPSEPVYWQWRRKDKPWANEYIFAMELQATTDDSEVRKLFTHPASKPAPLPELTDEEIELIGNRANYEAPAMGWNRWFARAIEQAVWEKMNGK